MVATFKRRPIRVSAMKYDGTEKSRDEIFSWLDEHEQPATSEVLPHGPMAIVVDSLNLVLLPGHWLVRLGDRFLRLNQVDFDREYEA